MEKALLTDATARFLTPHFLSLFKGFTLTTVAPIILIVIFTVIVVNILASLLADSPGPYPQFGKKLALTAADLWDNKSQYGYVRGRTLDTLGPLENILDGISESIKKWDDTPLYSTVSYVEPEQHINTDYQNRLQASPSYNNAIQSSPQFLTPSSGKIRFQ